MKKIAHKNKKKIYLPPKCKITDYGRALEDLQTRVEKLEQIQVPKRENLKMN